MLLFRLFLVLGVSIMSIIIPSKNIYQLQNPKVIKNKIEAVNYSYDNVQKVTTESNFNYDILSGEGVLNPELKTIKSRAGAVFAETEILIENFGIEDINTYVLYPSIEWTDRAGNVHYGASFRQGTIYYKELDRKLTNNDTIFDGNDYRLLIFKEVISRYMVRLTCYFLIGVPKSYTDATIIYNSSATINVSYGTYSKTNVAVDNGGDFSLDKNELMQNTTKADNGMSIYDFLSSQIVSSYKNGKEMAEILCQIGDYYDEFGEKIISASDENKRAKFGINDPVIPMVFSANGKDIPMSRYKNGLPKVFKVLGFKMIYDGAVWQRLTVQEV